MSRTTQKAELSLPAIQRLEAWMKEITDCLCYQPEIPVAHKSELVNAFVAFQNELTTQGVDTPRKDPA
jgi:hypothetical protein